MRPCLPLLDIANRENCNAEMVGNGLSAFPGGASPSNFSDCVLGQNRAGIQPPCVLQVNQSRSAVQAQNVSPRLPAANLADRLRADLVSLHKVVAGCPRNVFTPEFCHLIFGHLCVAVEAAFRRILSRALFGDAVMVVIPMSAKREVIGIYAQRRVATVHYQHPGRDGAVCHGVGEPVRQPFLARMSKAAIALVVNAGSPKPATRTASNLGPKSSVFHADNVWHRLPLIKRQMLGRMQ